MLAYRRGVAVLRRGLGSTRSQSSLRSLHGGFLDLVKSDGDGGGYVSVRDINDKVKEIKISNTRTKNSITGKMMKELASIVDSLQSSDPNETTVALILRASGDAFCSGADLGLVRSIVNTPERGKLMSSFMTDCLNRLHTSRYISCCIIDGPALGGGAELTTACDFRLMVNHERSYVQFIHCMLGASTGFGGSTRLSGIVSRQNALTFLASSSRISVDRGLQTGFVDGGIDADAEVLDASLQFLSSFTDQKFPESVRSFKTIVSQSYSTKKENLFDFETAVFKGRWMGRDNKSALQK